MIVRSLESSPEPMGGRNAAGRHRWLCIAYAFAPINRSGTHRTLGFVKHLDRLGWDATVLTVEPGNEPVDGDLMRDVPASTRILRTPWTPLVGRLKDLLGMPNSDLQACGLCPGEHSQFRRTKATGTPRTVGGDLREWLSRLLMTPDSRIGWIRPAVSAAMRSVREERPDIIYSTAPYMSAHLIAMIVALRSRIPWVADFRDPWRDNAFRSLGFKSLERWDAWLEKRVLRRASQVVCNTVTYEQRLCTRFPFLAGKCSTILNGFDSDEFEGLNPLPVGGPGDFVFAHAGQFYGPRSPIPYLSALRRVRDQATTTVRKPQLLLIGPDDFQGRSIVEIAREFGVADCVHVLGRLPRAQTLSYLAGSQALLLAGAPGSDGELQVPGKLFEYLALRKPILAGVAASGAAADILRDCDSVARICTPDDPHELANAMLTMIGECTHDCRTGHAPGTWSGLEQFDRARRAWELAALFERLLVSGRTWATSIRKTALVPSAGGRSGRPERSPSDLRQPSCS